MRLFLRSVLLFLLCFLKATNGGWLKDLYSPKGWNTGDDFFIHLVDSQAPNSTILERHTVLMNYRDYGVSVAKVPGRNAMEVGFYTNRLGEARGHHHSAVNMLIGFKMVTVMSLGMAAVAALAVKALLVAKIAAVISMSLLVAKIFHHGETVSHTIPAHIELSPEMSGHFADYGEYPPSGAEIYQPSGASNYYSYANVPPGFDYAASETSIPPRLNYGAPGNSSGALANQQVVRRRGDAKKKKKKKIPVFTVHQYSVKS